MSKKKDYDYKKFIKKSEETTSEPEVEETEEVESQEEKIE